MTGIMQGAGLVAALLMTAQSDPDPEAVRGALVEACEAAGGSPGACACVSREASSRFNERQMRVIVAAMPDMQRVGEPQALADQLGFSFDQILNLRQRALRADTVIRSACGAGLSRED
jgi:hypothetical protein